MNGYTKLLGETGLTASSGQREPVERSFETVQDGKREGGSIATAGGRLKSTQPPDDSSDVRWAILIREDDLGGGVLGGEQAIL